MASSEDVYTNKGKTVEDPLVSQERTKTQQEDDTTTNRGVENDGFGLFLVELENMLTLDTIRSLATFFNFKPGEIDQIERHQNASYEFIQYLKRKGFIRPQQISSLLTALKSINLHGVAEDVLGSYERNVQKLPLQSLSSNIKEKDVGQVRPPTPLGVQTDVHDVSQVNVNNKGDIGNTNNLQIETEEIPLSGSESAEQSIPHGELTAEGDVGNTNNFQSESGGTPFSESESSEQNISDEELSAGEYQMTPIAKKEEREFSLNDSVSHDLGEISCPQKMSEPFKQFLLELGLEKGLCGKYTIRDFQQVTYGHMDMAGECSIFEQFTSKITSYDYRVHLIRLHTPIKENKNFDSSSVCSEKDDEEEDWTKYLNQEESCTDTVNSPSARDTLFAILSCFDPFLLQDILMKLSACQLAVPILMPDCTGGVTFNLWGLRKVNKSWYDLCDNIIKTEPVVSHPFPVVAALRIGAISISKSDILNKLLGQAQNNDQHAYFLSYEEDPQSAHWSKGTLEGVWFLPNQEVDSSNISDAFLLLNIRGDSSHFQMQRKFATTKSFASIVFCDSKNSKEAEAIINDIKSSQSHVILVILQEKQSKQKPHYAPKTNITIIHTTGYTALEISNLISNALLQLFNRKKGFKGFCLESSVSICEELHILVDEAKNIYREAKKDAKDIYDLISQQFPYINKSNIFLLQKHWKQWAELDKNKRWAFKTALIEHEIEEIANTKDSLREMQCKEIPTTIMHKFLKYCGTSTEKRMTFIRYLEYYLNAMSNATFKPLQKDLHSVSSKRRKLSSKIKEASALQEGCATDVSSANSDTEMQKLKSTEEEITRKKMECIQKIDENSFGIEYFVREIAQITECHLHTGKEMKQYPLDIKQFPSVAADLLLNGYPIEIMDGDASHVPLRWVEEVLKSLSIRCGEDSKLYVISVLGIQSSGKSTILNSMFGVQFSVRAGRCTKGAFIQLVPVHETLKRHIGCDFIVIIDTEGLGAPEKILHLAPEHDNELATFSLCNSDLTLINIGGQTIGEEITNVLQIAAHAFIRMKEVNLNVECYIVQQFVADVTAQEKNEAAMENIMIKLDNAILNAAKEEGKEHLYRQFSDVFEVHNFENDTKNVQYIPNLWRGFMSTPDHQYSTRVLKLKQRIIHLIQMKENKLTLMDLSRRMADVWNAIKKEDFVFNFQNSKEIILYEELMKIYKSWISPVRADVMANELQIKQTIKNSKTERVNEIFDNGIKAVQAILDEECNRVTEKLSLYLNDQKYKEIKRYEMLFHADLSLFKTRLMKSATFEISQLVELSVKLSKKVPEGESLSARLHNKVAMLAADIREQINNQIEGNRNVHLDTFLTEKFEDFWERGMKETDEKYPTAPLSKISEQITLKVRKCIYQEIQNNSLSQSVQYYLDSGDLSKYSLSSLYIKQLSDVQRAKTLFNMTDEAASIEFEKILTKVKKLATENEAFSKNVVDLLQTVRLFVQQHGAMFDETTAICYFFSVFIRLSNDNQVTKELKAILQNTKTLSSISEKANNFLGDEIEKTLTALMKSILKECKYFHTQEQLRKENKSSNDSSDDVYYEEQTDKKKNLKSGLEKLKKIFESTPWAQDLAHNVEISFSKTKDKFKKNMTAADAFDHYCRLCVTYCCRKVSPVNLQQAITYSCNYGIRKFKEYGENFLKEYIDSKEYVMKYAEPLNYPNILSKIGYVLSIFSDEKVKNSEVIKAELTEEMVPKYGCETLSYPLFLHLDRAFVRMLPQRKEEILRSVYDKVNEVKRQIFVEETFRAPFKESAVSKVFSDLVIRGKDDFPKEMLAPTLVHIAAWLIPFCAVDYHEFDKSKNPATILRKEKDFFLTQFKSLCSETTDEQIAKIFVDLVINTAKESLIYKLCPELVREFLVGNDIFKVKRCFIGTILADICERDSYHDVTEFLNNFTAFSQQWILKYVVRKCNQTDNSLLKTTVTKCISDIKHAMLSSVARAKEALDNTNPVLSNWLTIFCDAMYKKVSITFNETEIDKFRKYLKVSNMQKFSQRCSDLLQDLDANLGEVIKLPTPGNLGETQQWIINELPKQIHLELLQSFEGCTEQCPFCGVVCEETLNGHTKHVANLHFPKGLNGVHWIGTKHLCAEICTSSVESQISYKTPFWVKKPNYRKFKKYHIDYPTWFIQGIQNDRPLDYWKYIFATFNERIAERYGLIKADLPAGWKNITKDTALQCIKATYQLN